MNQISANTPAPAGSRDADRFVPRLVVDEQGKIRFASEGFGQLSHLALPALQGQSLRNVLSFTDPDEALREHILAAPAVRQGDVWCHAIQNGRHTVNLAGRGKETFDFDFMWLQVGAGQRFLTVTASTTETMETPVMTADEARTLLKLPTPVNDVRGAFQAADNAPASREARIFLDLSDEIMLRATREGGLQQANRNFTTQFGYSAERVATLSFLDLVAPEDRAHVRSVFMDLTRGETPETQVSFEVRMIGTDSTSRWTDWRVRRIGDTIYMAGRDTTQMRRNEAAMLRNQQRLSEAEAIAHMGYWRWDTQDRSISWSDETYNIFGVKKDNFTPTLDAVNAFVHRRDIGRMMQVFQRALIENNDYDMDFRIVRTGGEVRYIRCEGRCETDEQGDVTALFGIMQDVTDRTRHERELRDAKAAVERAYAAKSQFLANMSHELRTPLNAVIGFSDMMQQQMLGPIGTQRYLEYIDGIKRSGEHLLDLISDILDMSKIEAGKYTLALEAMDMAKTVRLAVGMVSSRAQESGVTLYSTDIPDELPMTADRRAVLQIALNLLSNAVKFTEKGGSVSVSCRLKKGLVILKVADTGIGIPTHMLHMITRPFEQGSNQYSRKHEGTGLGLAITKELCHMHGGSLEIDSVVGTGTTVTVTLPEQFTGDMQIDD